MSPKRKTMIRDARIRGRHIESLVDSIKDELDVLADVSPKAARIEAARELIDYINLHYVDYQ